MNPELLNIDSVYSNLLKKNLMRIIEPLIDEGKLKWSGKYPDRLEPILVGSTFSPWIRSGMGHMDGMMCNFDHKLVFNYVSLKLPTAFVPSRCQECWKIVARPRTLKELWAIYEMQQKMDWPSKCGMEPRKQVFGIYGAYWYNPTPDCALDLAELLREQPELQGIDVIVKRGCSEFEWACGDSAQWVVKQGQKEIEETLEGMIVLEAFIDMPQPDWLVEDTKKRWIEWAWEHGDPTVYEFLGGVPLIPPYRTYRRANAEDMAAGRDSAGEQASEHRESPSPVGS
jgi:hypothetical protein